MVAASEVFSGVSHTFFGASAFESDDDVVAAVVAVAAVVVVAVAAAVDGTTLSDADTGGGIAAAVVVVCIIVVTVDVGVTELDADCITIFELTLYKYASYSGSGSTPPKRTSRKQNKMQQTDFEIYGCLNMVRTGKIMY